MHTQCVTGRIIARKEMTLYENATIGGVSQEHAFERQVVWIAKSESLLQFIHGGEIVKEGARYNDHYGYLTSMNLSEETGAILEKYGIKAESSLSLQLVTSLFLCPYLEDDECRRWNKDALEKNQRYKFIDIPRSYRVAYERDEVGHTEICYRSLGHIHITTTATWSSKNTPQHNRQLIDGFKAKWGTNALEPLFESYLDNVEAYQCEA